MPPSQLRGRPTRTTYVYNDPEYPDRVTATYTASPWTDEDRLLMLAWDAYQRTLCPDCGHPRDKAWHPDNDGWFEVTREVVCHACTAADWYDTEPEHRPPPRKHLVVTDTRDYDERPLPPLSDFYDD